MMVDLVHFGWEEDEVTPGDAKLSEKIRTEGRMRRRTSRSIGSNGEDLEDEATALPESNGAAENSAPVSISDFNVNIFNTRPIPPSAGPAKPRPAKIHFAPGPERSGSNQSSPYRSDFSPISSPIYESHPSKSPYDNESYRSSTQTLVSAPPPSAFAIKMRDEVEEKVYLDVTDEDEEDLNLISELAKAGHPNLDKIFEVELARSEGKMIVGCCGPKPLNDKARELTSKHIQIGMLLEGDPRGQLSLVCEDFGE